MSFNEHFLREVMPQASIIMKTFPEDARFSIDSRTLQAGDIFVAINGEHVDGHNFIDQALAKGAVGIIIATNKQDKIKKIDAHALRNKLVIAVPDTYDFVCKIAAAWRAQFTYPVLAITGSVGKSSIKKMTAAIMHAHKKNCHVAQENQNTKIGVALNIMRMKNNHDCAIFEVGISQRGEMSEIAHMLRPTIGLISCIGHSHMEGLGSLADIAAEKRALFKYFGAENIGIINGDQPLLTQVSYAHPIVKFGLKSTNQIQARKISQTEDHTDFIIKIYNNKYTVSTSQIHPATIMNTLACAAASYMLGASDETIVKTIQQSITIAGRFEQRSLKNKQHGTIINDAYNANPESMKAALATFGKIKTDAKKIVIIGDMLELGANSAFWHRQIGRILRKMASTHDIILVGNHIQCAKKSLPVGANVEALSSWQEVIPVVEQKIKANKENLILIKGSHGTGLHYLADALTEKTLKSANG